jgi:aryl-alcohol dehydrogenase-like predicted oxidoreductase
MAYRRLGRTGLMVSEVVSGGDPITLDNYEHLNAALERGLNYLDMAPAYNGGQCEQAYGRLIGGASSRRDKVILTTKVSGYSQQREAMYREVFQSLGPDRQAAIVRRAAELQAERGIRQPGYYLDYFPGQAGSFEWAYRRLAMAPDYAQRVEGSQAFRKFLFDSVEGSLKRLGTDHVDCLMCPHGANAPEDLDCADILPAFEELKRQGTVRFLGVTAHNDPAGVLRRAADLGHYDLVMCAYNVINGGHVEEAIRHASDRGVGVIAMKSAMAVATHHKALQPTPQWRIDKVNRIVPGDWKPPQKAYIWSLQNPRLTAVCSNLWDRTFIEENVGLAGTRVELQPA